MFFLVILLSLIHQIELCPLTDEYLSRCHCGILTNGESYIKCEENSLNHVPNFKRSFSYDELILVNNNIKNLTSTAFDNIKTIKRINLYGNFLSFIDENLLRLLGNYLEELVLTGNNKINSLEFLTRYPLKKLRLLKLNQFDLTNINLEKLFQNMTNLESIHLNSCQLRTIPNINHVKSFNLEHNLLSNTIFLSTKYSHLNLAHNYISSIILQNNKNLISLNLSNNHLNEFYSLTISNRNLTTLDLSHNRLSSIDWTILSDNLIYLNLSSNLLTTVNILTLPKSLISLDLSSNQLKTIDKTHFIQQLNFFDINFNPLDCNCHLKWLKSAMKTFNTTWSCSLSDFKCQSVLMPQIKTFNITFIEYWTYYGFLIQWSIIDNYNSIHYLQVTFEKPYEISKRISSNQTHGLIFNNHIQLNDEYRICLIVIHKYARDSYCQNVLTKHSLKYEIEFDHDHFIFNQINMKAKFNNSHDKHIYLLLIGSCIGALLTLILLITCCYLCYKIYQYKQIRRQPVYEKCSQHIHYPMYHSHPPCSHHQMIYNSENASNSTDSSQMETSSSLTANNLKHIYQTIDSQDFHSLKRQHPQLFELWHESVKQKR